MMKNQEGFTIVEAVIAMVLMSVILVGLAGLMYYTAQAAVVSDDTMKRDGYALEMLNRLDALPYASLPASFCDTAGTSSEDRYSRCVTVTTSASQSTIVIVTTPMQRHIVPVTYRFTRAAPPAANPLCISTC